MKKILLYLIFCTLTVVSVPLWAAPLDINTASAQQLAANLKGVGVAKAAAIIAYREAHGPFRKVDDLAKVKGIGMRIVDINRDHLVLGARRDTVRRSASRE